ncbi:MAG: hypothetical protein OXG24_04955 [Gammaproteobacteria bacterium]|nr:hypothetical protein [Gammaproteobacteria bacterium]
MIFLVFGFVLAIVGYWIHLDTKYRQQRNRWTRKDANLLIHEERKSEQLMDQPTSERDEGESPSDIDLILLDDVESAGVGYTTTPTHTWFPYASAAVLAVFALGGYLIWGDPFAMRMERIQEQFQNATTEEDLDEIIRLLQARNSSKHGDIASANYLISAYSIKEDYESVVREHKLAEQRGTNSLDSDVDRVRAAFDLDGQRVSDETQVIVDRILSQVPDHPMILQLMAIQAYTLVDYPKAREYLERLLRQPVGSRVVALFEQLLTETIKNLDENHVGIHVKVHIEELVTPHQWLYVFAQLDDGSPPIAVVRRANVGPGTYSLLLDDIVSMVPGRHLSSFDRVVIVARISPSSNVADIDGASQIQSGWVSPSPNTSVSLRLSENVAVDSIAVTVALDPGLKVENDWPVFVIGRRVGTPGPPLVVKRVLVSDLPISLTLSANDTMLPDSEFPKEAIEVFARASSTGSATRSENDIESQKVQAKIGQSIGLRLDQLVEPSGEP